jgi:hypothetical protein
MELVDHRLAELRSELARSSDPDLRANLEAMVERVSLLRARIVEAGAVGGDEPSPFGPSTHALP